MLKQYCRRYGVQYTCTAVRNEHCIPSANSRPSAVVSLSISASVSGINAVRLPVVICVSRLRGFLSGVPTPLPACLLLPAALS